MKNNKASFGLNSLFKQTFFSLKGKWFQAICIFLVAGIFQALIQSIPAVGGILGFIISGPVTVGYCIYSLNIVNDNFPKVENILDGFKFNFGNNLLAYLIITLIVIFVGFLILFVFCSINFLFFLLYLDLFFDQSYEAFILNYDWNALLSPFKLFSFESDFFDLIFFILFLIASFCFSIIIPFIIASLPYSMTFFIMAEDYSIDAWEAIQKSRKMMKGFKRKYLILQIVLVIIAVLTSIFTVFIGLLWFIPLSYVITAVFYNQIKN
ncbi:MAG: DUF975 family protein [Flavobacteriaceae bacterium]